MLCAQGQWTVLQGAEDTELLRKDAVHHLVKVGFVQALTLYKYLCEGVTRCTAWSRCWAGTRLQELEMPVGCLHEL